MGSIGRKNNNLNISSKDLKKAIVDRNNSLKRQNDAISLEANDYPITIDKLLIDQIKLSSGDDTDDTDKFSVISFH